jgi:hypothetical protein
VPRQVGDEEADAGEQLAGVPLPYDGTVFEITANSIASGSPTITTLASFNYSNGASV